MCIYKALSIRFQEYDLQCIRIFKRLLRHNTLILCCQATINQLLLGSIKQPQCIMQGYELVRRMVFQLPQPVYQGMFYQIFIRFNIRSASKNQMHDYVMSSNNYDYFQSNVKVFTAQSTWSSGSFTGSSRCCGCGRTSSSTSNKTRTQRSAVPQKQPM